MATSGGEAREQMEPNKEGSTKNEIIGRPFRLEASGELKELLKNDIAKDIDSSTQILRSSLDPQPLLTNEMDDTRDDNRRKSSAPWYVELHREEDRFVGAEGKLISVTIQDAP
ncbi:hypothetical protein BY996DRAFT_6439472 [Phakopsora pachyrhizi]|nr:hypothetical protein BY996DRAFT_6439472 [Phakopsora pachyrhizi]